MARIRTIKPEFPQSESMGRVSRDARLTFIELWTLADDCGRLRGKERLLASLLFPYDADAPDAINTWLAELEREECITRYNVGSDSYIAINHWNTHQKIDHPGKSKLPSPPTSRDLARDSPALAKHSETLDKVRRGSEDRRTKDQGSKDQGRAREDLPLGNGAHAEPAPKPPDPDPDPDPNPIPDPEDSKSDSVGPARRNGAHGTQPAGTQTPEPKPGVLAGGLRSLTDAIGPDWSDPAVRKAAWETAAFATVKRALPEDAAVAMIAGYLDGKPEAKAAIERIVHRAKAGA